MLSVFFELTIIWFVIIYILFLNIDILNLVIRKKPPLPTSSAAIKSVFDLMEKHQGKTFVDLGCGMGKMLAAVKKRFPRMEVEGYENWPTQFILARIILFFSGTKGKIFYKDLFHADLKNADIVYCYLYPELMEKLEKKLEKELNDDVVVISNSFPLPHWKPRETIITNPKKPEYKKIFVYRKRSN